MRALIIFFSLIFCFPTFANDFGVNNCGQPCYSGGCPECPEDFVLIIMTTDSNHENHFNKVEFKSRSACERAKEQIDGKYSAFGHATGAIRTVCSPI